MSVFANYDSRFAGKTVQQSKPNVYVYPWIPNQRNVRANPNIPSQPQRIQPQERGASFPTSASNGGSLAPMQSSCSGCAGCAGGCGGASVTPVAQTTASDIASTHSLPASDAMRMPRAMPRATGSLRPSIRSTSKVSLAWGR